MAALRAGTARNGMGVVAVCGDDVIVLPGSSHGSNDNSFLSDIEMAESANFLLLVCLRRALFKTANQEHQVQKAQFPFQV